MLQFVIFLKNKNHLIYKQMQMSAKALQESKTQAQQAIQSNSGIMEGFLNSAKNLWNNPGEYIEKGKEWVADKWKSVSNFSIMEALNEIPTTPSAIWNKLSNSVSQTATEVKTDVK